MVTLGVYLIAPAVLELVRTIVARLEGGGFQLQPFLVIGIISAIGDILGDEGHPHGRRGTVTRG